MQSIFPHAWDAQDSWHRELTDLHATKVHQQHPATSLPTLQHNIVRLDIPAKRGREGCALVLKSNTYKSNPASGLGPDPPAHSRWGHSCVKVGKKCVWQLQRWKAHLWMTGGRREPRYCRICSTSPAMRSTSASSARHPPRTSSPSDRPSASSCGAQEGAGRLGLGRGGCRQRGSAHASSYSAALVGSAQSLALSTGALHPTRHPRFNSGPETNKVPYPREQNEKHEYELACTR